MAKEKPQTFDNHVRWVPAYHFVALPIFLINVLWSLYGVFASFSFESVLALLVAVALLVLCLGARIFTLTVQDRVIRLEMRLRLTRLLPPDLQPRVNDFTVSQLVSLRFSSDKELPELARKVLADNLADRKTIKQMIRHWQPDVLRA